MTVELKVTASQLAYWNDSAKRFLVESGIVEMRVGVSSMTFVFGRRSTKQGIESRDVHESLSPKFVCGAYRCLVC
jgi:hypothetical protein